MNNVVLIAAMEAETAAKGAEDQSFDGRLRAAMESMRTHWMATDEDDRFMAACEGFARTCTDEERERVERSLRLLSSLSAASSGVPVDFGELLPDEDEEPIEPARLLPVWQEVNGDA